MQQYSIVGLGKELEKYGLRVGENPAFGSGKVGKHAPNSHHYYGEAIDVTDWRPGEWQQRTQGLSQRAKQLGVVYLLVYDFLKFVQIKSNYDSIFHFLVYD